MKLLVALAALATAAPSVPQDVPPTWTDARPPVRFQRTGFVPVVFVPLDQIDPSCGMHPPEGMHVIACTRFVTVDGKELRIVIMPDPCAAPGDPYAEVQCHENSHYLANWQHETQ